MYSGNLKFFYDRFKEANKLSYSEQYDLLLNDTTEFVGSYARTLTKMGNEVKCAIANDYFLQNKWKTENDMKIENERNVLFEQVKSFQPEILSIENLSFTDTEWFENIRTKVKSIKLIIAFHCSPFSQRIIERLKYVDFLITCTPGLKQEMEDMGIKTYLVYHGFDKDILSRVDVNNESQSNNFVFSGSLSVGAGFHGERLELIENILKADLDLELYVNLEKASKIRTKQALYSISELLKKINLEKLGNRIPLLQYGKEPVKNYSGALLKKKLHPVYGIDMFSLFHNSKIVLNSHIGVAGSYGGNMRLFEVTGLGSCLLTDNKKNLGDLFDISKEIVVYDGVEDCIAKAKWLLGNENERKKIADAGHQRTMNYHTVENRCRLILDIIDNELNQRCN
jgi:spore maturation protein CgeB